MGNPTIWFEVAGKDQQALKGFYSQLFDWQITDMEAMPYATIETGNGEGIPGGIGAAPDGDSGHVTFYVRVDDIDASLAKAEQLGATVLMPKMEIPNTGWMGLFKDPTGNMVGLFTSK